MATLRMVDERRYKWRRRLRQIPMNEVVLYMDGTHSWKGKVQCQLIACSSQHSHREAGPCRGIHKMRPENSPRNIHVANKNRKYWTVSLAYNDLLTTNHDASS